MIKPKAVLAAIVLGSGICFAPTVRAQEDPSLVGEWSPVQDWPVVSVHTIMLPTREVLFWASDDAHQWNPETDVISPAAFPLRNIFCSGHAFLPDGTILVSGGHIENNVGLNTASIYDPYTDFWTDVPNMNGGRWYPSSTTLANGDVLVTSGDDNQQVNQLPEVFELDWADWKNLTSAERSLPLYPRTFLGPDGRVFYATSTSRYLDTSGTGGWSDVADRIVGGRDNYGSAVMYEAGKVLWTGGGDPPTETCEIIDLNDSTPSWEFTGSMAQPRRQNNVTLLPDGKVLATGGSSSKGFDREKGAIYTAEMWDPNTGQWTTMASYQEYRGYHSTAVLLPDGRVLSSGGDDYPSREVYSPPYLFNGIRPTITSAPASIDYGETFLVETADTTDFSEVNMLRLGSSTHAHNFDQWFCPVEFAIDSLDIETTSAQLSVSAPTSGTACPPGPYMLFVLNSSGVPSVAEILLLTGPLAPAASLTFACTGLDCSFTDTSLDLDGTVVDWSWSFGDGAISSAQDPSHSYAAAGTYTVTLTVTDNDGGFDAASVDVAVPTNNLTTVQVSSGLDDVEESASGEVFMTSSDLEMADDDIFNGPDQTVGIRITGVDIPQGANIANAYLQFQVDEVTTGAVSLLISGESVGDAPEFSTALGDVSSRQTTTSSVAWVPPDWTVVGSTQQTPDLTAIVQEIVSMSDWAANNAMAFIIGGFGRRTAESYEGGAAPILHVEYALTGNQAPTASFTFACTDLDCSFTDTSTDSDGSVDAWSWDFGDGDTSSTQSPNHSYAAAGTYTVMLTVTDDGGATNGTSQTVVVNYPAPPGLHVGDIDGSKDDQNKQWRARATFSIHDTNHIPVSGATVSYSWIARDDSGSGACTTNIVGQCLSDWTPLLGKRNKSVTFTVQGVASSMPYQPASNHDPDGDSNGTTIAVAK